VLVHETAHQWWGDLVLWKSYRDQWLMEGLANYASLLVLEQ
jgi:aminopeptidase N